MDYGYQKMKLIQQWQSRKSNLTCLIVLLTQSFTVKNEHLGFVSDGVHDTMIEHFETK